MSDQHQPRTQPADHDAIEMLLNEARAVLPELDDAPAIRSAVAKFTTAANRAAFFRRAANGRVVKALRRADEGISIGARAAEEQVQADGGAEESRQAAASAFRLKAGRTLAERVLRDDWPEAQRLGEAVAAAGQEVDREIERAALRAAAYWNAGARPLEELLAEKRELEEIKATGLPGVLARVRASFNLGDEEGDEEGDRLIRLVLAYANEITRLSNAKLADKFGGRPGAGDAERAAAIELLGLLQRRTIERTPTVIRRAAEVRDRILLPLFTKTCGVDAWRLSDRDFRAIVDNSARVPARWELAGDWHARGVLSTPLASQGTPMKVGS